MKRRRVLGGLLGVVVLCVLAIGAVFYATFSGLLPIADGARVGGTVEVVADGYVSVDLLDLGDGHVALIDCGNRGDGAPILAALERRHLGADDVSAVLVTHGHPDHIAACARFPHATIYALREEIPMIEGRTGGTSPVSRTVSSTATGLQVAHPLADGDVITLGNAEIRVYAVPGHTAGSAAYLVDGVLFVGDSASVTAEHTLRGAPWIFSDDQARNVASMHALGERLEHEGLTVTTIVASHTGVLDEGDVLAALRAM